MWLLKSQHHNIKKKKSVFRRRPSWEGGGYKLPPSTHTLTVFFLVHTFILSSVVVGGRPTTWARHGELVGLGNPEVVRAAVCLMDGLGPPTRRDWLCVNSDDSYWLYSRIHWGDGLQKLRVTKAGEEHAESTTCIWSGHVESTIVNCVSKRAAIYIKQPGNSLIKCNPANTTANIKCILLKNM